MIQVAVIEDDPDASRTLQDYLERYQAERKTPLTVTAFPNGLDIAEDYRPVWDVILLDIEMPLMDGMSAARHIRKVDQDVVIIFITNMAKYAIKGYEVDALDFVLKPVSYFAFAMKMDKALSHSQWAFITAAHIDGVWIDNGDGTATLNFNNSTVVPD